jgi:hypothetical protein
MRNDANGLAPARAVDFRDQAVAPLGGIIVCQPDQLATQIIANGDAGASR